MPIAFTCACALLAAISASPAADREAASTDIVPTLVTVAVAVLRSDGSAEIALKADELPLDELVGNPALTSWKIPVAATAASTIPWRAAASRWASADIVPL